LPRGPQLKNELFYIHFFRHARSQESDWRKWNMRRLDPAGVYAMPRRPL
jgi:hypothetical protein